MPRVPAQEKFPGSKLARTAGIGLALKLMNYLGYARPGAVEVARRFRPEVFGLGAESGYEAAGRGQADAGCQARD